MNTKDIKVGQELNVNQVLQLEEDIWIQVNETEEAYLPLNKGLLKNKCEPGHIFKVVFNDVKKFGCIHLKHIKSTLEYYNFEVTVKDF